MGGLVTYIISIMISQWLMYTAREYTNIFWGKDFKKYNLITLIPAFNIALTLLLIIYLKITEKK